MIARVYGRWMPGADPEAGSKAGSAFRGPIVVKQLSHFASD